MTESNDVLAVMDRERATLVKVRALAEWSGCANVAKADAILSAHDKARAAVAELIERGEYLCRTGEGMIAFRAALAACTPAKPEGR